MERGLLDAFRRGDGAALEQLYRAHVDAVALVIRCGGFAGYGARLSGAPRREWQDLIHETFRIAFEDATRLRFDGLSEYGPFLLGIARHVLSGYWRKHGREISSDSLDGLNGTVPVDEGELLTEQTLARVRAFIDALEPPLSDVHDARFVRGLSQYEAAAALALSRQKIRTLEDKLKRALRLFLQKEQPKADAGTILEKRSSDA